MAYRVKNASGIDGTWVGQLIANGEYYDIQDEELSLWRNDADVFSSVSAGDLIVNKGLDNVDDINHPNDGWKFLLGNQLPISELDGTKLAVHSSPKPIIPGSRTYAVWAGAGDDIPGNQIGDGPILEFELEPGKAEHVIDVKFLPDQGRVWLHEGYLKFENGGIGDYLSASVNAEATPLQQVSNLDLIVEDNWVKFASGGAGTGTHGFADPTKVLLIPRTFSKDGDWDYDGVNLIPNTSGTGSYKISNIERIVHKYINKIPCRGTSSTFFTMSSDETAELPKHYFVKITAANVSNTTWNATVLMEIYRERTYEP